MISNTIDARNDRADALAARGFNGMSYAILRLLPDVLAPTSAEVEVFFLNTSNLPAFTKNLFSITGGRRVVAGSGIGQVSVTNVKPGNTPASLLLTIAPIGDYSTYTLTLSHPKVDLIFQDLEFKFRPGCFSIDCAPAWDATPKPEPALGIDYLSKDFESFRHTLHTAMSQRVPGWQPSSRADLDETLIDLIAAAGDELSDYQDRVMNEAYLATCRNRVSLARHSRLMDYHIHQGCQASTWLALMVNTALKLGLNELQVRTGSRIQASDQDVIFSTREMHLDPSHRTLFDPRLNEFHLYTWSNTKSSLKAGATTADLKPLLGTTTDLKTLIVGRALLIQEVLNPATGAEAGRSLEKRQVVIVRSAVEMTDAFTTESFLRVTWDKADALRRDYCFTAFCADPPTENCATFFCNLIRIHHGAIVSARYREPGTFWGPSDVDSGRDEAVIRRYRFYERGDSDGTLCRLPQDLGPMAYVDTEKGGTVAPVSSISRIDSSADVSSSFGSPSAQLSVDGETWTEVISLVHSDDTADNGHHYAVETDERQRSVLRFGNGINGSRLPPDAVVELRYQLGGGNAGNVGANALVQSFDVNTTLKPAWLDKCWNPLDVINGCDPEPVSRILRNAPEAFRARQERCVTLADYVVQAQRVPGVSRAVACYAWTGSWRTVRVTLDPSAGVEWPVLLASARQRLEAVHLIGEDLEIRPPIFVPLEIVIDICLRDEVWPEDVRFVLEQEFSTGWTPDGRMAFFHPDQWTFGQSLHRSQIEGRIQRVPGIEHILRIKIKRFNDHQAVPQLIEQLTPRFNEIFEVRNDPDSREHGFVTFNLSGGRL